MNSINKASCRQLGIGLLELMLALAIIAVLLIMATRYYQSTSQSQKVNQAAGDIQAIIAAAANFRAGDPNGTIDQTKLKPFAPASWDDWSKANPWGGKYGVAAGGTTNSIKITVEGMTGDSCNALATLTKSNAIADPTCAGGTLNGEYGTQAGA